jgi:hypothetical protein
MKVKKSKISEFEKAMKKIVTTPKEEVENAIAEENKRGRTVLTAGTLAKLLMKHQDFAVAFVVASKDGNSDCKLVTSVTIASDLPSYDPEAHPAFILKCNISNDSSEMEDYINRSGRYIRNLK